MASVPRLEKEEAAAVLAGPGRSVTTLDAPDDQAAGMGRLFGRDLIYVVIWSLQLVTAVVVSPVLAYILGPSEFGSMATGIAIYQVLMVLAVIGFDRAITLQMADDPSGRSARSLLAVGMVIAVSFTVLAGTTAGFWGPFVGLGSERSLVIAIVLWTGPGAVVQLSLALLMAQDRLKPFAAVSCLSALGGPVFGIALVFRVAKNASTYAWGGVISQFAGLLIALLLCKPLLAGLLDRPLIRSAFSLGVPIMLSGLSVFVLTASDRVVISRLLGSAEVGRYQIAYTVGYVVVLGLSSVSQAWTPRLAAVRDKVLRRKLTGRSRDELYRLCVPIILGITLAAPILLRIVAPPSFDPASLLIVSVLVAAAAFPVAASGATSRELLILRRTRPLAVVAFVAGALNVGLNLLLVPLWGISGAAASTLVAFSVQALLQRRALDDSAGWPRTPRPLLALIGLACLISAGSSLLPQTTAWNLIRLSLAIACLPWLLLQLRASRKNDLAVPA
ncbi:O-antigen/teichoic acid export membrane protein [Nakamurella sp. UYEF19]|uniref:lipopolysaccharide biosynthesis protein n=1 Tax=Nakamurella sp. UYEF19 TaxID=1756392 RepID=UPI003396C779